MIGDNRFERVPAEDLLNVLHWLNEGIAIGTPPTPALSDRRVELRQMIDYVLGTDTLGGSQTFTDVRSRVLAILRSQGLTCRGCDRPSVYSAGYCNACFCR